MPSAPSLLPGPLWLITGAHDNCAQPLELAISGTSVLEARPTLEQHTAAAGAGRLDLTGWTLLSAAAEPHAHLDKAFLGRSGHHTEDGVRDAVRAMRDLHGAMTETDIAERARRAAELAVRHGYTALRSHVDVGGPIGTRGVKALTALRDQLADVLELQLVALPVQPVSGRDGADGRRWLLKALDAGADIVGGAPWLDIDPVQAVDELTAAAAHHGAPIDLHIDETTRASVLTLERFVHRVEALGLGGRATASHCVSLGQQPVERARGLARHLASAGVAVVALPQTNLYLQGRGRKTRALRGLPPLALLEQAGALVAAGGDNWRDPFNPLGRADPLETAGLLVAANHVTTQRAYHMVSEAARRVMGLTPATLKVGDVADLLAVRASDLSESVAGATEERIVVHRGRLVAHTELCFPGPSAGVPSARAARQLLTGEPLG